MKDISITARTVTVFILFAVLFPVMAFGAGVEKLIPALSIYNDGETTKLKQPEGVTCNEELSFIIADSGNGRLLRFTLQEDSFKKEAELKVPQLTYPLKIKTNSSGEIFALNSNDRRIVHLGSNGEFIGFVDPAGMPSPAPYVPRSFDIDKDDNIYILDILSERVLILGPAGEYQNQIPFPEGYGFFSDLSVDFKGTILLIDSINARVFSADRGSAGFTPLTESLRAYMRYPTSITTGLRGRIYLVDKNSSLILFLGQDGSFLGRHSGMGWKEGLLNHPSQMCISEKGYAFIADTDNNRVQVFSLIR